MLYNMSPREMAAGRGGAHSPENGRTAPAKRLPPRIILLASLPAASPYSIPSKDSESVARQSSGVPNRSATESAPRYTRGMSKPSPEMSRLCLAPSSHKKATCGSNSATIFRTASVFSASFWEIFGSYVGSFPPPGANGACLQHPAKRCGTAPSIYPPAFSGHGSGDAKCVMSGCVMPSGMIECPSPRVYSGGSAGGYIDLGAVPCRAVNIQSPPCSILFGMRSAVWRIARM